MWSTFCSLLPLWVVRVDVVYGCLKFNKHRCIDVNDYDLRAKVKHSTILMEIWLVDGIFYWGVVGRTVGGGWNVGCYLLGR